MKKGKGKKILMFGLGGLLALVLFVVVALLLLPHFINMQQVKGKILARVSQELRGQVNFERVDVRFFPVIKAVVYGGSIKVPDKADISLEKLQVSVKFFPLLEGKVIPSSVDVEGVKGWVRLGPTKKGPSKGPVLSEESVKKILALIAQKAPGLKVSFQGGDLTLYRRGRARGLTFSGFEGELSLPPGKLRLSLSLSSPHASDFLAKGWLDAQTLEGRVEAKVKGLDLSYILSWFDLDSSKVPKEALVNMALEGKFQGLDHLEARVEGSIPCLRLRKPSLRPFMCSTLEARLVRDGSFWHVFLDNLAMEYPRITLKGEFALDPGGKKALLELTGTDVDVPSVRKVVLSLAGGHKTVCKIFEIVRGGRVPSITFRSQGARLKDLEHLDSMVIRGTLEGGVIRVPKVHLMVEDVGGKVLIQKGILYGQSLVGRLEKSRILSGTLRVDLRHNHPFRLKTRLDADLSQLPGVLKQVLHGGILLSEIKRVSHARGKALGLLTIVHDGHETKVEVDAQKVSLACNYSRVPYPIKIVDGSFSYRGSHIQVKGLRGYLGKSAFNGLSARVDWGTPSGIRLKVSSMRGSLLLDELFPWITSYPSVKKALRDFSSMKGRLQVAALSFDGPVSHPKVWKFRLQGGLRNFAMDFSLFPDTLKVKKGGITMTPQAITFQGCSASLLDASPRVSGSVRGYLQGVDRLELTLDGPMGAKAVRWVYDFIHLSKEYWVKAPLVLKGVHVLWERKGRTDFSGEVRVGRVTANLDLEMLGDLLLIRELKLDGLGTSARIGLTFQGKTLSLNFKGRLGKGALDTFLENNVILRGEVRGDFALYLVLGKAAQFSAKGDLTVRGLSYLWGLKMPIMVDQATIKARGAGVDVEKASLSLEKSSIEAAGRIDLVGDKIHLDMDVSAPSLDVKEIEALFQGGEKKKPSKNWDLPLEGEVRAQVFSVFYNGYTWSPVEALIHLSPNEVKVDVEKALLCGISTPGTLTFSPGKMSIDARVEAHDRDFEETLQCLFGTEHLAEGHFSIEGYLKAWGKEDPIAENSTGEFTFETGKGRLYRFNLLSKVFSVIGVTEVIRGRLPILNINKEGFGYRSIKAKGRFKNGVLLMDECVIDGNAVRVFASGKINFAKDRMDITVLVAPFKVLDSVLSRIPILGRILTGKSKTLVSVPVKVTGRLEDPKVTPLSPASVGSGILGIVKRTIEAPVKLIAPNMGKGTKSQ